MNPVLLFVAFCVFIVFLFNFITKKPTDNYPPGPPRLPFIGSYLHVLWHNYTTPFLALLELTKQYKSPVVGLYLGGLRVVVANDFTSCKEVFTNPDIQGRVDNFPFRTRALGKKQGIFDDDGPEWLHLRRLSLRQLRDLGFGRRSDNMEQSVEEEVKDLIEIIRKDIADGVSTEVPRIFYPPLLNSIAHVLQGSKMASKDHHVLENLGKVGERFLLSTDMTGRMLGLFPWLRYLLPDTTGYTDLKTTSDTFVEHLRGFFEQHKDSFELGQIRDLMDVYIKHQATFSHFTDDNLVVSLIDLTFPNTATAGFAAWMMIYMIQNPDVQKKCQRQIDEVVGRGRFPTLDDRTNLPYVEATLRESLRKLSLAPLGVPHMSTADTKFCGYDIPKDTAFITNIWAMNMEDKLWGDPDNFRPERFLDSRGRFGKDVSLTFGLGKRVCAGETFARNTLFLIFSAIMQNFTVEEDSPIDLSSLRNGIAILVQSGLRVHFKTRE